MVEHIQQIISEYQQRIVEMPYVPKRSYGHAALGINGGVNMVFLTFLFSDKDLSIQFLKDVGVIRSKVPCNTCGRALIQQLPMVLDGDVEGSLLRPNVLSRRPSGTAHGSTRVNSLSRRYCTSHTKSCAEYQPT
jgi:hypothetical protein